MHYKAEYLNDIEQGTPEWIDTRLGRLTGTDAHLLCVAGKKDPDGLGAGLVSLLTEKAADYIVGQEGPDLGGFWINRGTELEPEARANYIEETFNSVQECGFIAFGQHGGHSPDGLIGDEGMIEIKCPAGKKVIALHEGEKIDTRHYAQMQWGLAITGRRFCVYRVYHPSLKPYTSVIARDEKLIEQMLSRFYTWEQRLTKLIEKYSK